VSLIFPRIGEAEKLAAEYLRPQSG